MGQKEIFEILKRENRELSVLELAELSGISDGSIQSALRRMSSFVERKKHTIKKATFYKYKLKGGGEIKP